MARRAEPDYVSGERGSYEISPPVTHPPRCVCDICPNHRAKAVDKLREVWTRERRSFTEADLRLAVWSAPLVIRSRRQAPEDSRSNRRAASGYAYRFKTEEEQRLVLAVAATDRRQEATANAVPFGRVCDAYRAHQQTEKKRYDRDRYRIDAIEEFFGRNRDTATIDRDAYDALKAHLATRSVATIARYTTTLVAMMNHAIRERIITGHSLTQLRRPKARKTTKPVTFTRRQREILLGPAMDAHEREQAKTRQQYEREQRERVASGRPSLAVRPPSEVPLRGFCLVAFLTLMRPDNNFGWSWEMISLHPTKDSGRYRLEKHKNSSKGVEVEAGIHPLLVRYLRQIWPGRGAKGLVHPNPATGEPYVNIRKQWARLIEIANGMLPSDEQITGVREHFYTWRHTGASELAATGADPVMIVRMMGDVSLKTVMDHYFDSSVEHMQEILEKWEPLIGETRQERAEEAGWAD